MKGPAAAVRYLIAARLLGPEPVVNGEVVVREFHRRQLGFHVSSAGATALFVKQGLGAEGRRSLAHEGAVYRALGPRLAAFLPRVMHDDREAGVLVLETAPDSEDLRALMRRTGRVPVEVAADAGRALGALHAIGGAELTAGEQVTTGAPWILSVHRPPVDRLGTMSGAQADVVRTIQAQPAAMRRLDALRRSWRREAATHGDVRWDNLVAAPSAGRAHLVLVDWEAAGAGDPDWDLGCALSEHLSAWISSIPLEPGASPGRLASLAGRPLLSMWPAIAACWEAYRTQSGLDPAESQRRLRRAARYAGARLLQTAFELGAGRERPDGAAARHLQVGANVLARPREAAERLLGLDPARASLR